MKVENIKEIARERGIKTGKMKKVELIRIIQEQEGNPTCFASGKAGECGENRCLWREDCT